MTYDTTNKQHLFLSDSNIQYFYILMCYNQVQPAVYINCAASGNSNKETQQMSALPALVDDAFPAYDVVSPVPPFCAKDSVFPQALQLC
jgi:hypothetical protein